MNLGFSTVNLAIFSQIVIIVTLLALSSQSLALSGNMYSKGSLDVLLYFYTDSPEEDVSDLLEHEFAYTVETWKQDEQLLTLVRDSETGEVLEAFLLSGKHVINAWVNPDRIYYSLIRGRNIGILEAQTVNPLVYFYNMEKVIESNSDYYNRPITVKKKNLEDGARQVSVQMSQDSSAIRNLTYENGRLLTAEVIQNEPFVWSSAKVQFMNHDANFGELPREMHVKGYHQILVEGRMPSLSTEMVISTDELRLLRHGETIGNVVQTELEGLRHLPVGRRYTHKQLHKHFLETQAGLIPKSIENYWARRSLVELEAEGKSKMRAVSDGKLGKYLISGGAIILIFAVAFNLLRLGRSKSKS